jgi:hypothetical protein
MYPTIRGRSAAHREHWQRQKKASPVATRRSLLVSKIAKGLLGGNLFPASQPVTDHARDADA